jgi:hypothetical protein
VKIKEIVNGLFLKNTDYSEPDQATNQASSLMSLSTDLYTDSKRFVYELLQNADDAANTKQTVQVWITIFDDSLVVAHTGKVFDERDLRGICNVNNGTKKADPSKTGYKGIGFKSVFGQSDKITILTGNEYFRFDLSYPFEWNSKWEDTKLQWERKNEREFNFPWQIIPIFTETQDIPEPIQLFIQKYKVNVATIIKLKNKDETIQAIKELSENANMFLFLKNVSEINFDIGIVRQIKINRSVNGQIVLSDGQNKNTQWLTNSIELKVPSSLSKVLQEDKNIPEKLSKADTIELILAAKTSSDGIIKLNSNEKLLYSFLPTEETKYSLPVLVNTSFLTNSNRENLHADSKWNQWLFKSISIEIFKWISQLVETEFKYQAYRLIPSKILNDELGMHYNQGIDEAIDTVAFVREKPNKLVKIKDSIIDFTFLSKKKFVGENTIKGFIDSCENPAEISSKVFIENTGFGTEFKSLGASTFEWSSLPKLIQSKSFLNSHSIEDNIELIRHLKLLSEKDPVKDITLTEIQKLPFIWDHKNNLTAPFKVYFPTGNDLNWNSPDSDLSFLHPKLQDWLSVELNVRSWIEKIGVVEKTDITFITKTIIPDAENYITKTNAIQTFRDLFNLYKKDELAANLISQLSNLKILTTKGLLRKATDCLLSNVFSPRVELEKIFDMDIFVSNEYLTCISDRDEWKRFFKLLGVQEGIECLKITDKTNRNALVEIGFVDRYFSEDDKKFKPFHSTFISDSYIDVSTLIHINNSINNHSFSRLFWNDVIENTLIENLTKPTTAYWGNTGRPGQTNGDNVGNYIPWFIKNHSCIPVVTKKCESSGNIFVNTKEITQISGNYLPIFDGETLAPDWLSFFNFKTTLQFTDYLEILNKISSDIKGTGEVKENNFTRIQAVYKELLLQCTNWTEKELEQVGVWANSGHLLSTKHVFLKCNSLKYFLDGNNVLFHEQLDFLELNAENKNSPNLERLLKALKIKMLKQSDFELITTNINENKSLAVQLIRAIPYLNSWVVSESNDEDTLAALLALDAKIDMLEIFEADMLKVKYGEISFTRNVNVHFDLNKLYITRPWNTNRVLIQLSDVLCSYFNLVGHDKKLDFLLRSNCNEISEYFEYLGVDIPAITSLLDSDAQVTLEKIQDPSLPMSIRSFNELEESIEQGTLSLDFVHISTSDYQLLKFAQKLLSRSVRNIISFLSELPEYDCANQYEIAPSVIGGVTKNGSDITIVARPSDNDVVILFYTAEFDVLEYVDAEFWCEDGTNVPSKITLGKLLKIAKINRIPITNLSYTYSDLEELLNKPKSVTYDFNAVPLAPYQIAQTISSFANSEGGTLVFGINEVTSLQNEIVGLSADYRLDEILKKAITFLAPIPKVTYDWVNAETNRIFIIKVDKSDEEISLGNQKYLRLESKNVLKDNLDITKQKTLSIPKFAKTIAIVIGIENYAPKAQNQIKPVKYAENDARLFKDMLINKMDVEEENIHLILNESALKSSLQFDLQSLFHALSPEDRLVFYYVGHGFHNGISNYLSTYDMHPQHIDTTAISLREVLLDPLLKSKCKSALIFIDSCAQSFQVGNSRNTLSNIDGNEIQLQISEHNYLASYFSCQPGQSSYSCDKLQQGIWTFYLTEAIGGGVPEVIESNKYITDRSLTDYLKKNVAKYAKEKLGKEQNPKSILDTDSENVIIELKIV